jgi:hypothetical protein
MALSPTALFQGIDTFQGQLRSAGITGTHDDSDAATTSTVSICTDTESVSEAISASASVSGSAMDTSADVKATFVENLGMTSTSVVVVVYTTYQNTKTQDTLQLSDEAAKVLGKSSGTQDVQDFYSGYGDSYVSQLIIGGEYYAAFVYDSTTSEQQEDVTASLKASDLSFSTSLSTSLSTVSSSTSTSLRSNQQMVGSTANLPATDPTSIIDFATNFPSQVNAPKILSFAISGYEHVPGVSSTQFQPVVTNRTLLGDTFTNVSLALSTLNSQVTVIQNMYIGYGYTGDPDLFSKALQIQQDVNALNDLIGQIAGNVTGSFAAPSLPSLAYGTPIASYVVNPNIVSGTTNYFYDLSAAQIANGVGPEKITLYDSGFQVLYSDDLSVDHGSGGNEVGSLTIPRSQDPAQTAQTKAQNQDYINLIQWLNPTFDIGKIQTKLGQSVGAGTTPAQSLQPNQIWMTATKPVPLIAFNGSLITEGPLQGSVEMSPVGITISPAVWVQSDS